MRQSTLPKTKHDTALPNMGANMNAMNDDLELAQKPKNRDDMVLALSQSNADTAELRNLIQTISEDMSRGDVIEAALVMATQNGADATQLGNLLKAIP